MSYDTVITRLYAAARFSGKKWGLATIFKLSEALSFPERTFKSIHVAGSNGKGSVAIKIATALECAGFKVGMYTSPHITCFRERIVVQGERISEEDVIDGMNAIFSICDRLGIKATFFELATALAFDYFRKRKVDFSVVETGIGGRLDATNIILPEISVITSITCEHIQVLGNTLEKIAIEKSGIIKPGIPVVIGSKARLQPILHIAKQRRCSVLDAREVDGFYDDENNETAKTALGLLSERFSISPHAIEQGLKIRPPCRFEKIGNVILDVAHNPDAMRRLLQACRLHFPAMRIRLVFGISEDKEITECLRIGAAAAEHMHLVEASSPRAAKKEHLAEILTGIGYRSFSIENTVSEGVLEAIETAGQRQELVLVCGSFFIMSDAKKLL